MKKLRSIIAALVAVFILLSLSVTAFAQGQAPFDNSSFFECGDYTVHYRVFAHEGEYKGRIMMLHGFGCSTYSWEPMAKKLSRGGYDCVLADLPNFGYTTREDGNTELVEREELIKAIMKSIAPMEEWILAGHSMGGAVAMNIACDEPSLKALLLYCPAPVSSVPTFVGDMMNKLHMGKVMSAVLKYGTRIDPLMRMVLLAAFVDWDFSMSYDVSAVAEPLAIDGTGEGLMNMMMTARPSDFDAIGKIKMPVLLVNAQYDMVLMPGMKAQVKDALPNAENYTVQKGGHMCNENRAEELGEVTLNFLDKSI